MSSHELKYYPPAEERLNVLSHAAAFALSLVALVLLLQRAASYGTAYHVISFGIYGLSLLCLYAASSCYHFSQNPIQRRRFKIFDHAAIYLLIAGTYTPFTLVTLHGPIGWSLFAITWSMAICGIVLKLFFTGRFKVISTLMYVFMGWLIVFAYKPLSENFAAEGLQWLVAGGVLYTLGAVLYSIKAIPFNHAIFHVFVVAGSFCHFIAVYAYIIRL